MFSQFDAVTVVKTRPTALFTELFRIISVPNSTQVAAFWTLYALCVRPISCSRSYRRGEVA